MLLKHQLKSSICTLLTCLTLFLTNYRSHCQANQDNGSGGGNSWSWRIDGTSASNPNTQYIYNDVNFVTPGNGSEPWNCGRTFLFAQPVNEPVTFSLASITSQLPSADYRVTIYPLGNSSNVLYQANFPWTSFNYTFPNTGSYVLMFSHLDPYNGNGVYTKDLAAEIEIIKPVQRVWLELPEICINEYPTNADYHFKLKTFPLIQDVMHATPQFTFRPAPGAACEQGERYEARIDNISSDILIWRHGMVDGELPANPINGNVHIHGFNFNPNLYNGPNPTFPDGFEDFYIPYSFLAPYLTSNYSDPIIRFDVYIGFKTFHIEAPLIIHGSTIAANSFHVPDYTVGATNANEVWTPTNNPATELYGNGSNHPVFRIQNVLKIPDGTSLKIKDMTVEMGPGGEIIVANNNPDMGNIGGYLKLENSTLTAYHGCGNEQNTWRGIQVWGHSDAYQADQLINTTPSSKQGMLEMDNSTISYARDAVETFNPAAGYYSTTGGIINATNSNFLNNRRTIYYGPYDWRNPSNPNTIYAYRSTLLNCNFSVDNTLPETFMSFIAGWSNRGPLISGCSFINSSGTGHPDFNMAINGYDFGIHVGKSATRNSSFTNFKKAIDIESIDGNTGFVRVRDAIFDNNVVGIDARATQVASILRNTFTVPRANTINHNKYAIGVNMEKGSGYFVSDNTFKGGTIGLRSSSMVGVRIENGASDGSKPHTNTYNGLGTGNLSNFQNQGLNNQGRIDGLQFLCNNYSDNGWDEAAKGYNPLIDGMNPMQGSEDAPAGNKFNGGNGHAFDIYNPAGEVAPITYSYYSNDPSQVPSAVFGNVSVLPTSKQSLCDFSGDNENPGNSYDPYHGALVINTFLDGGEIATMDGATLFTALNDWNTPYGKLMQVGLLIGKADYAAAHTLYNSIAPHYALEGPEATEFTTWGQQFMDLLIQKKSDGTGMKDLTATQVAALESIEAGGKLWAKARAQNGLSLYEGRVYENEKLFPEDDNTFAARGTQNDEPDRSNATATLQSKRELAGNKVYPNPVHDLLTIRYHNQQPESLLEVTDITGKVLLSQYLTGKNGTQTLDVSSLANGLYLYRILEGKTTTHNGKIIKQ